MGREVDVDPLESYLREIYGCEPGNSAYSRKNQCDKPRRRRAWARDPMRQTAPGGQARLAPTVVVMSGI